MIRRTVALIYPPVVFWAQLAAISFDTDAVGLAVDSKDSLAVRAHMPRRHCFHTLGLTVMHVLSSSRV